MACLREQDRRHLSALIWRFTTIAKRDKAKFMLFFLDTLYYLVLILICALVFKIKTIDILS